MAFEKMKSCVSKEAPQSVTVSAVSNELSLIRGLGPALALTGLVLVVTVTTAYSTFDSNIEQIN